MNRRAGGHCPHLMSNCAVEPDPGRREETITYPPSLCRFPMGKKGSPQIRQLFAFVHMPYDVLACQR